MAMPYLFLLLNRAIDDILKSMNNKRISVRGLVVFIAIFFSALFASCNHVITNEEWLGLYLNNQKIGFQHIVLKRHDDGYFIHSEEFIKVSMYGQEKRLSTMSDIKVDGQFNLNAFDFTLKTQDQTINVEGTLWGDTLSLKISSGDLTRKRSMVVSGYKLIMPGTFIGMIMAQKVKPDKYLIFDPSTFKVDTAVVAYEGKRALEHRGKRINCKIYALSYIGTTTRFWTYDDGKIARVDMPMQMFAVEEPPEEAKKIGTPMDILSYYAVKVEKEIPRDALSVKLRLSGIKPGLFDLDFGPQFLIDSGDTWAEVKVVKGPREAELVDTARYLASDEFIQSDDPRIKETAARIVKPYRSDSARARAILDWVYSYLEKRPGLTVPSALDVLEQKYGDCNEHSVLFAARARAAGIPTDVVVGLIYQQGAYYYHAWDAVYIEGKWYFVDPIFHEFPASVHHLMLKRGGIDKQSDIVSIIGNLKIKVLEVK